MKKNILEELRVGSVTKVAIGGRVTDIEIAEKHWGLRTSANLRRKLWTERDVLAAIAEARAEGAGDAIARAAAAIKKELRDANDPFVEAGIRIALTILVAIIPGAELTKRPQDQWPD